MHLVVLFFMSLNGRNSTVQKPSKFVEEMFLYYI